MKLISWNVNGLRACIKKGFFDFLDDVSADFVCIQETKMQEDQVNFEAQGYELYFNSAIRKGYSGTAIFTKKSPLRVIKGIGKQNFDEEGRVLTLEYPTFYLVNVYTPKSKRDLSRLTYRLAWDDAFRGFVTKLALEKPLIICGDFNVAHQKIDVRNHKTNYKNSGFTQEEREKFSILLEDGFVDTYRLCYPHREDAYSWWSYMSDVRERNIGWRIDYFLVTNSLINQVEDAFMMPAVKGSDHCPIGLNIDL